MMTASSRVTFLGLFANSLVPFMAASANRGIASSGIPTSLSLLGTRRSSDRRSINLTAISAPTHSEIPSTFSPKAFAI